MLSYHFYKFIPSIPANVPIVIAIANFANSNNLNDNSPLNKHDKMNNTK